MATPKTVFKLVFSKIQNESRIFSEKDIIAKMRCPRLCSYFLNLVFFVFLKTKKRIENILVSFVLLVF